jgi:hypothetical protein
MKAVRMTSFEYTSEDFGGRTTKIYDTTGKDPNMVFYPAAEVDGYRRKVAALVEAAKKFEEVGWTQRGWEDCLQQLKAAIAAVEEYLAGLKKKCKIRYKPS